MKLSRHSLLLFIISLFQQQITQAEYIKTPGDKTGDALRFIIPASALAATLFYEDGWEGTIQFSKSLALNLVVTETLKRVIERERPNGDCCMSFPSGHASASFMGAAFIHKRYGWQWAGPAYIAATYVGWSRVDTDRHDWGEVLGGAAVGIASSFIFTEPYSNKVKIMPYVEGDGFGLAISGQW